ncbi:MAG: hypothetical protein ACRD1F_05365, partial [Terriglobales bacterium]
MHRRNLRGILLAVVVALALVAISDAQGTQAIPPPPVIQHTPPPPAAKTQAAAPLPTTPPPPFAVSHYDLNLSFNFAAHTLDATAKLTIVPNAELATATLQLNQALRVKSVTSASGNAMGHGRTGDKVLLAFTPPLEANTPSTITMEYTGALPNAGQSPISGIRTAYVGPDGAFLLYPGEWFPMAGYDRSRFSADITATLPAGMSMVASGTETTSAGANGGTSYHFQQAHASFPGTVIVTPLQAQSFNQNGVGTKFYFSSDIPAALTADYAKT